MQIASKARVKIGLPFGSFVLLLFQQSLSCISLINQTYAYKLQQKWVYVNMWEETQHTCQNIHVAHSAWTPKSTKTQTTHCHKDKLLDLLHCVQQTLIKTARHGSVASLAGCRLCEKMLKLCTALTPQTEASLRMKARSFCSYNCVFTGVNQRDTAK